MLRSPAPLSAKSGRLVVQRRAPQAHGGPFRRVAAAEALLLPGPEEDGAAQVAFLLRGAGDLVIGPMRRSSGWSIVLGGL